MNKDKGVTESRERESLPLENVQRETSASRGSKAVEVWLTMLISGRGIEKSKQVAGEMLRRRRDLELKFDGCALIVSSERFS